jgi:hypothetical protein
MVCMACFTPFRTILLTCLFLSQSLLGETFNGPTSLSMKFLDEAVFNGPATLKWVKAKSLVVNGPLQFSRLDVAGRAVIQGPFKGDHGKFDALEISGLVEASYITSQKLLINGPVKASYLKVTDSAEISGPLDVQNGEFQDLKVSADLITLDTVTARNIVVGKSTSPQTLILQGVTVISEDIRFESGKGVIKKIGTNVDIRGQILGGRLE